MTYEELFSTFNCPRHRSDSYARIIDLRDRTWNFLRRSNNFRVEYNSGNAWNYNTYCLTCGKWKEFYGNELILIVSERSIERKVLVDYYLLSAEYEHMNSEDFHIIVRDKYARITST